MKSFKSLKDLHETLLTMEFEHRKFLSFSCRYHWSKNLAATVCKSNPKKAKQRMLTYVDYHELERIKNLCDKDDNHFSIRMRIDSPGKGPYRVRGDYSMLAMSFDGRLLTIFYRSLDFYNGLVFDQAIILTVVEYLKITVGEVVIMAASACVNARVGGVNEKVWKDLTKIYKRINKTGKFYV